jgi:lycopene beta-cyclase
MRALVAVRFVACKSRPALSSSRCALEPCGMTACDIAIAGGGLSGGLIALALKQARPDLSLALVEQGRTLGGNHRWSWFASDLPEGGETLLGAFPQTVWDDGYEVRFPAFARALSTRYRSLISADFDAVLRRALPSRAIHSGKAIVSLDADGITLEGGKRIDARAVIDCRGFAPTPHLAGGWQVFLGGHVRTKEPHNLKRPIIMDASVEQLDGYRFVYSLPLGPDEVFVEDTYYLDDPLLDRDALAERLDAYCKRRGWIGEVLAEETGVLPVVTGGNFAAWRKEIAVDGVALAGARGGFWNPLTSYTVPQAVTIALLVAENADLPGHQLAALLEDKAREHWKATRFYRLLARMLFGAAAPAERYKVLERFYRLPRPLIERLYAGRSTAADKRRILCGKPPVPVTKAVTALLSQGRPLEPAQ